MITDVPGVRCGHWTDASARTGCTVALLPSGTVASAEVRGGAPASRELEALQVGRLVDNAHAVVLTGGSAYGLAAADGVMAWCEEQGIGFDVGVAVVPIVPALGIFDLAVVTPWSGPDLTKAEQLVMRLTLGRWNSVRWVPARVRQLASRMGQTEFVPAESDPRPCA